MSASAALLSKAKRPIGVVPRTADDENPDPCSYEPKSSIKIEAPTFRYAYGTDKRSEVSDHALFGGKEGGPTAAVPAPSTYDPVKPGEFGSNFKDGDLGRRALAQQKLLSGAHPGAMPMAKARSALGIPGAQRTRPATGAHLHAELAHCGPGRYDPHAATPFGKTAEHNTRCGKSLLGTQRRPDFLQFIQSRGKGTEGPGPSYSITNGALAKDAALDPRNFNDFLRSYKAKLGGGKAGATTAAVTDSAYEVTAGTAGLKLSAEERAERKALAAAARSSSFCTASAKFGTGARSHVADPEAYFQPGPGRCVRALLATRYSLLAFSRSSTCSHDSLTACFPLTSLLTCLLSLLRVCRYQHHSTLRTGRHKAGQVVTRRTTFGISARKGLLEQLADAGLQSNNPDSGPGSYDAHGYAEGLLKDSFNRRCGHKPTVSMSTTALAPHAADHVDVYGMGGELQALAATSVALAEPAATAPVVQVLAAGLDPAGQAYRELLRQQGVEDEEDPEKLREALAAAAAAARQEARGGAGGNGGGGGGGGDDDAAVGLRASGTWRFLKRPTPHANFADHGLKMELKDAADSTMAVELREAKREQREKLAAATLRASTRSSSSSSRGSSRRSSSSRRPLRRPAPGDV